MGALVPYREVKAEKAHDALILDLGHASVAMTLNASAEVDPDAKCTAVGKVGDAFDMDLDGVLADELEVPAFTMSFTVEQLRSMLAKAEVREADR